MWNTFCILTHMVKEVYLLNQIFLKYINFNQLINVNNGDNTSAKFINSVHGEINYERSCAPRAPRLSAYMAMRRAIMPNNAES